MTACATSAVEHRVREALWLRSGIGRPRAGRHLRTLLEDAGFDRVSASARYISYSSSDAKYRFASERVQECEDSTFARSVQSLGLADATALAEMHDAWLEWPRDPGAFLAFAWCDALGWKRQK